MSDITPEHRVYSMIPRACSRTDNHHFSEGVKDDGTRSLLLSSTIIQRIQEI